MGVPGSGIRRGVIMDKLDSMLLKLKDTSEFMVDLAYSSLLYNNRDIAEEVINLEVQMDKLGDEIQKTLLEMAKENPESVTKAFVVLRLQIAIEDIANAAASIADVVLRGYADSPVIQMSIKESEWTIERATVSDDSVLRDKTLGEMRLWSHCGMFVMAIKRGAQYIFRPDRWTTLREGDVLIAIGPEESADHFMALSDGSKKEF